MKKEAENQKVLRHAQDYEAPARHYVAPRGAPLVRACTQDDRSHGKRMTCSAAHKPSMASVTT